MKKVFVNLRGGLGNQLFQLSTMLAYAWTHNMLPIIKPINESPSIFKNRITYWDNFFSRLRDYFNNESIKHKITYTENGFHYTSIPEININENQTLELNGL